MFKFSLSPSFGRGYNKKTPAYAEYVEIHQKHNMKFFSIFLVWLQAGKSLHISGCKGITFSEIFKKSAKIVFCVNGYSFQL